MLVFRLLSAFMRILIASIIGVIVLAVAGMGAIFEENALLLLIVVCLWNPALLACGWGLAVSFSARSVPRRRKLKPAQMKRLLQEDML